MIYLLDTNICIAFINGDDVGVRDRLLALEPPAVKLCSVVRAELLYGARNSSRCSENLVRLGQFFAPFQSLPFDDGAAEAYGQLRSQLRREGRLIGGNDMLIAATALSAHAVLVTHNQDEFRRVPGLSVECW